MITEKDITFGDSNCERINKHWQYIIKEPGEFIGVLTETFSNIFNPIETRYQRCVIDNEENRKYKHFESEDRGFIIIYFNELQEFLDYYNKEVNSDG